jgi:phospholipid/cholesterol/gamma-HCH transport system permease protein
MERVAGTMTAEQIAQLVIEMDAASATAAARLRCAGAWVVQGIAQLERRLEAIPLPDEGNVVIDGSAISALDTSGAWLLHRIIRKLEQRGCSVAINGLRPEFSTLLQLVASCATASENPLPPTPNLLARIGRQSWRRLLELSGMLSFIGECAIILLHSLARPHRIRWRPVLHNLQTAGFEALPITGLLSFLMGVVIAYQGADQLQRFGANVFIADLVGLTMLRELSPLLTAIIVAGRSGSAYAAQIGTMKITEEIDALRTIGVRPQELLVLPKMLALIIALPLLTVYTDATGVLGGMIMARSKLDVSFDVFLNRLGDAVSLSSFLTGICKAPVFAAIIALVGCHQGFQVTDSADSVGRQTTVSVVQSIFLVIVADALFSVAFNWLKI